MARATALSAVRVKTAEPGTFGDGDGLYLLVRDTKSAFWFFRYKRAGRVREMGLGRARGRNSVTLAEARDKAGVLWRMHKGGVDPLTARDAEQAAQAAIAQADAARAITFRTCAGYYLDAHDAKWTNPKHRAQWTNTLETYAYPHFGDLPVSAIGTAHVLAALEPIWQKKAETATRVRGRVEAVLNYAATREWRAGENPARWRGHLSNLLPARAAVAPVEHHAALPWAEVGAFMVALRQQAGVSARALEFAILTAARSGEVLGATWGEFDLAEKLWTIPAGRMKAKKEHRVPLTASALAILADIGKLRTDREAAAPVFPGATKGRPLSVMALTMVLRRMKRGDVTPHGFRSTFRDWVGEHTAFPREIAEAALAHVVANKTEAAYSRGDALDKRRAMMAAWATFCAGPYVKPGAGNVVPMRAEGA